MTEGTSELALINVLIASRLFSVETADMLDEKVFHKRQVDGYIYTLLRALPKSEKITIIRIGDTLRDELKIDKRFKTRIQREIKICTKPELEKLVLISEGLMDEWRKTKLKPSVFLKMQQKRYLKNYEYLYNYFLSINIKEVLSEYKRITKHARDEYYLIDFVN